MGLTSNTDLRDLDQKEKHQIVDLLNSGGYNSSVAKKITFLQNEVSPIVSKQTSTRLQDDEATEEDLYNSFYNFTSGLDEDAECEGDYPWGTVWPAPFSYKWTIAKSALDLARVVSYEKLYLYDLENNLPAESRWIINNLVHQSSFMIGLVGNISYTEVNNENYFNSNGFFFYVKTAGVIQGAGMARLLESERYVNAGAVVQSNGKVVL